MAGLYPHHCMHPPKQVCAFRTSPASLLMTILMTLHRHITPFVNILVTCGTLYIYSMDFLLIVSALWCWHAEHIAVNHSAKYWILV